MDAQELQLPTLEEFVEWFVTDNAAYALELLKKVAAAERLDEQNHTFAKFFHDSGKPEVRYKVNDDLHIDQVLRVGELERIMKGESDE